MKKFLINLTLVAIVIVILAVCVKQWFLPNNKINQSADPAVTTVTADPIVLITEIKKLARLETVSISLEQTIQGERDQSRMWGAFGEKMTFTAYGQIVAGIDLGNIKKEDIVIINSETIEIHLRSAEIFYVIIDNQKSYVVNRDSGVLAKIDKDLETRLRQKAESEFRKNALKLNILDEANLNADAFMRKFLQSQGFKNVSFINAIPSNDMLR